MEGGERRVPASALGGMLYLAMVGGVSGRLALPGSPLRLLGVKPLIEWECEGMELGGGGGGGRREPHCLQTFSGPMQSDFSGSYSCIVFPPKACAEVGVFAARGECTDSRELFGGRLPCAGAVDATSAFSS